MTERGKRLAMTERGKLLTITKKLSPEVDLIMV
jgi:hypothetical protein